MKNNFETAGKTAKRELIKEISNTLWRFTTKVSYDCGEVPQACVIKNINGYQINAVIDALHDGALLKYDGKKYRTHKGSTLKRDIVDTVTEWVDELTKVEEQPTTEKKEIKKAMVCQTAIKYLLMAIESDWDGKHAFIHRAYNTLADYSDIFATVNLGGLISFLDNGASVKMVNSVIYNSITVLNEEIGDCLLEMNK